MTDEEFDERVEALEARFESIAERIEEIAQILRDYLNRPDKDYRPGGSARPLAFGSRAMSRPVS